MPTLLRSYASVLLFRLVDCVSSTARVVNTWERNELLEVWSYQLELQWKPFHKPSENHPKPDRSSKFSQWIWYTIHPPHNTPLVTPRGSSLYIKAPWHIHIQQTYTFDNQQQVLSHNNSAPCYPSPGRKYAAADSLVGGNFNRGVGLCQDTTIIFFTQPAPSQINDWDWCTWQLFN